jgi:hypothetical protein
MKIINLHGMTKIVCVALLFGAMSFINCPSSLAETIQTAATGQKTCYDEMGNQITCEGTGQDGEFQTGAQWPNPRFVVNLDTCSITDNLTGLIWGRFA